MVCTCREEQREKQGRVGRRGERREERKEQIGGKRKERGGVNKRRLLFPPRIATLMAIDKIADFVKGKKLNEGEEECHRFVCTPGWPKGWGR